MTAIEDKYHGRIYTGISRWIFGDDPERRADIKRYEEIPKVMREIINKRIDELQNEANNLEKTYPKFGRNLRYALTGVPKEVKDAQERWSECCSDIQGLRKLRSTIK